MAKSAIATVGEYIASLPKDVQPVLKVVRSTIRKAVPKAEETISYKIPAIKLPSGIVLYYAGWKEHYSLYPATKLVLETFKKYLAGYQLRKGTIRFPFTQPVPVRLIARIAKLRARECEERAKAKAAVKKMRSTTSR
jgi:uncharacterized protein YdhG (YjbR/CyaY superfamily)